MYSPIYQTSRLLWPGGREAHAHLGEIRRSQWFSRSELEEYQLARIRRLVKHAYDHIPYYRTQYDRLGLHPDDIKTFEDFQALPILTKQDVLAHLDELVDPRLRNSAIPVSTGASTGEPMRFYVEDSFWRWNIAYENRGREWHGVREGDKIAWVWGARSDMYDWGRKARLKARIMRHRYLNAFAMTESKMRQFAEELQRWKPDMFRAYASMIYLFARFLRANKINGIRPKFIETTAEKLKPHQRELIEDVFGCRVADCYTAREFATVGYACESGGIHVGETRYLELIANGQVVSPGQVGQVVVTSLHQFLMPFIRYRLDDEACYLEGACPCGRGLPALREILGRTNDYIVTPRGLVHDGFFAFYFWSKPEVVRYQVNQEDRDHLEVRLICSRDVDRTWLDSIRDELTKEFEGNMRIDVQRVDEIALTRAGKHRFIVSKVARNSVDD